MAGGFGGFLVGRFPFFGLARFDLGKDRLCFLGPAFCAPRNSDTEVLILYQNFLQKHLKSPFFPTAPASRLIQLSRTSVSKTGLRS